MRRILMITALIFGLYYLYAVRYRKPDIPPPPPALNFKPLPPLPAIAGTDLSKVREATHDSDPAVRWAAIELLYSLHDPQAAKILENTLAIDTEPSVRKNALEILRHARTQTALKDLVMALNDPEKEIRIAALMALGEIGNSSVAPQVTTLLSDADPEVRLQALHTLNSFQQNKGEQYEKLLNELKAEYEEALQKAQNRR